MKLFTVTLAAAALGMTGFAYAGGAGDHAATIKAPTVMTNAQMDATVAGSTFTGTLLDAQGSLIVTYSTDLPQTPSDGSLTVQQGQGVTDMTLPN